MNDIIRTVICTATGCGVTGAISFSLDVGSKSTIRWCIRNPSNVKSTCSTYRTVSRNSSYRCITCTDQEKKTEEDEPMVDEKKKILIYQDSLFHKIRKDR